VTVTKTVVVVAVPHAETVVAIVAEAEANVSENKDSSGGINGDGGGNVGLGGGRDNCGWQRMMAMAAKTGSAVAAVATVAMLVADNYSNCGGRQQSIKCSSGSS
jgi:hypothetical protein